MNYIETPGGQKIQLNVTGSQIFDGAGSNSVFAALNNLVADYSGSSFDPSAAIAHTQALGAALNFVSQQRVTIDNSMTQLTSASNAVSTEQTQLTAAQTNLMQADIVKISTQLALSRPSSPLSKLSSRNWDPAVSSTSFPADCPRRS